jgi:hypothetical protein
MEYSTYTTTIGSNVVVVLILFDAISPDYCLMTTQLLSSAGVWIIMDIVSLFDSFDHQTILRLRISVTLFKRDEMKMFWERLNHIFISLHLDQPEYPSRPRKRIAQLLEFALKAQKGLSFISNSQRRNEGTFSASELAGIEPTPPAPKAAGYVRLDLSVLRGEGTVLTNISTRPCF